MSMTMSIESMFDLHDRLSSIKVILTEEEFVELRDKILARHGLTQQQFQEIMHKHYEQQRSPAFLGGKLIKLETDLERLKTENDTLLKRINLLEQYLIISRK